MLERQQVGAEARQRVALGPGHRLRFLRIALGEARVEERHDRNVETVEPYHRHIARIAMIVERPRRRDDEIARMHRRALTIDRGVGAFALDHHAQRGLGVAMAGRNFARKDELQTGVQAVGDR